MLRRNKALASTRLSVAPQRGATRGFFQTCFKREPEGMTVGGQMILVLSYVNMKLQEPSLRKQICQEPTNQASRTGHCPQSSRRRCAKPAASQKMMKVLRQIRTFFVLLNLSPPIKATTTTTPVYSLPLCTISSPFLLGSSKLGAGAPTLGPVWS